MPSFDTVDTPQLLEVSLGPPSAFTRLFIFTGTAIFQLPELGARDDDNFVRERLDLLLSRVHGNIPYNPQLTQVVGSASPSSIHGTDDADDFSWAVDRAFADISPTGELILHVDAAVQGSGGLFSRFAYQVFLQTAGMQIVDSTQSPSNPIVIAHAATTAVSFTIQLFPMNTPASPSPGGIVNFRLKDNSGNVLSNSNLGLPNSIVIPAAAVSAGVDGAVQPSSPPRTETFTLDCITALGLFRHTIIINQL
jgi:hypothetical protein